MLLAEEGSTVWGKQVLLRPFYLTVVNTEVTDPVEGKEAQQQWQAVHVTFFAVFFYIHFLFDS